MSADDGQRAGPSSGATMQSKDSSSGTSEMGNGDKEEAGTSDGEIMLGFKSLSLSAVDPPRHIIANVTGFVVKGGITALLGPSSGGKSLLMKVLTGRMPTVQCTGEVTYCGKPINPQSGGNGFGFVPQDDNLIGDITVRETFEIAARLRNVGTLEQAVNDSEEVIQGLGLGKVGDNVVGTVLKRGLSGGEKRRTSVGQELVVRQALAFLDEPTSGLDGTAAYDVIKTIKDFTCRSNGKFSVVLSIHQPNRRILDLFDHILLLGRGGSLFFGTLDEAIQHFTDIGYPPPPNQVPTDFFLQVTDDSFALSTHGQIDFTQVYATSEFCVRTVETLEINKVLRLEKIAHGGTDITFQRPGFWRQFTTLLKRDAKVAVRDPTLYYLQLLLHVMYGFIIGAAFYDTPKNLDDRSSELVSACVWILMAQSYIHIFKVFYLVNANRRFSSERANLSYGVVAYFAAELVVTALAQLLWIPGCSIAYYMIGIPAEAYWFSMLALYVTSVTSESMVNLITKLTDDASLAIVMSQACIVTMTVFAGGLFRPFEEVPDYWRWLQNLSVFTQSSQTYLLAIYEQLAYDCPSDSVSSDATCFTIQYSYPCDAYFDAVSGICQTKGTTVLDVGAGGLSGDKWEFLRGNLCLFLWFRIGVLFFLQWPRTTINHAVRSRMASPLVKTSLEHQTEIQRLWGEVGKLKKASEPTPTTVSKVVPVEAQELSSVSADVEDPSAAAPPDGYSHRHNHGDLVFRSVKLTLPKTKKVLVDNVTGKATAGRVLALMGPSGAGKTTLLNALSGRATYAKVSGSVTMDGRALRSDDLNYVPQFDDLNEFFTPREVLTYMSLLKVIDEPESRRQGVFELLHILGLSTKADMSTASLSGGERKRLSIGLGMVSEPAVLFLDEPTTGLASAAAFSVVGYISKLASQTGVVCIMTIHQPAGEVFDMLEDLMLLEGGRLAYFGTTKRARLFFDSFAGKCPLSVNPADYYLDLISKPPVISSDPSCTCWKDLYQKSEFNVVIDAPKDPKSNRTEAQRPSWTSKAYIVIKTMLKYYWRIPQIHWLRMLELVTLALFMGTMFLRLNNSEIKELAAASFFNIWCLLFVVVASAPAFTHDRRTTLQEMLNGAYEPALHCVAQFVSSAPFIFMEGLIYQSIFHWLVGFNDSFGAYIYAVLSSTSLLFMMEAIMLMVVEGLKNAMLACTFNMILLGILCLFTGFFIKPADMLWAVRWITYILPTRYAFDGYLYSIFHGQDYVTSTMVITGDQILQSEFAQSPDVNQWHDLLVVMLWVFLLRIAHFGMIYLGILPYRNNMAVPPPSS